MSTVAEIKAAIDQLTPQERCELEALLHPLHDDDWDRQMRADSELGGKVHDLMVASLKSAATGKFDTLNREADAAHAAGLTISLEEIPGN